MDYVAQYSTLKVQNPNEELTMSQFGSASGMESHPLKFTNETFSYKKYLVVGVFVCILLFVIGLLIGYYSAPGSPAGGREYKQSSSISSRECPLVTTQCPPKFEDPPLLLISLDGFRADYLLRMVTPSIQWMIECGSHSPFMRPIFPSKTFPNHYTIATGLYAESHGIIDNTIIDPETNKIFKLGNQEKFNPDWYGGEPIWITAMKQGKKTGAFFWPGADVQIKGIYPDFYRIFNTSTPFSERVDTILEWLDLPSDQRPSFFTMYFNEPDTTGHKYGPDSVEVNKAMGVVDAMMNRLLIGLEDRSLLGCVNIILVADHGMEGVSCSRAVTLSDMGVNLTDSDIAVQGGTFGRIRPMNQNVTVDKLVKFMECGNGHIKAYKKQDLPTRYHYATSPKIEPIVVDVDDSWLFAGWPQFCSPGGVHGYDNMYKSMQALFVAIGPSFNQNYTSPPFLNIELYNLMTTLLKVEPAPNNGTMGSLFHLLKHPPAYPIPNSKPPSVVQYPSEETIIDQRRSADDCPSCPNQLDSSTNESQRLIMNESIENRILSKHQAWGTQVTSSKDLQLLINYNFLLSYDPVTKRPLWVQYLLTDKIWGPNDTTMCWRWDVRLKEEDMQTCGAYNTEAFRAAGVFQEHLFPLEFSTTQNLADAWLTSNSIPMKQEFKSGIMANLLDILKRWTKRFKAINVVFGPVYDFKTTGLNDESVKTSSVPTHFFCVVTRCVRTSGRSCNSTNLDVTAFILPHRDKVDNCQTPIQFLSYNSAKVRDVEILTGLEFYSQVYPKEAVRLRTHLVEELWY